MVSGDMTRDFVPSRVPGPVVVEESGEGVSSLVSETLGTIGTGYFPFSP